MHRPTRRIVLTVAGGVAALSMAGTAAFALDSSGTAAAASPSASPSTVTLTMDLATAQRFCSRVDKLESRLATAKAKDGDRHAKRLDRLESRLTQLRTTCADVPAAQTPSATPTAGA